MQLLEKKKKVWYTDKKSAKRIEWIMAKKHQYRASAAEKKKRQAEQQKQKNAAFWAKYKMPVIIGAAALIVIVIAAVLMINGIAAAGSIPMKGGQLEGVQPNWLVDKLGGENSRNYFKVAEVNIPDGYKDLGGLKNDPLEQNFFLVPTAEDAMVENVTIMSMPGKNPQDLANGLGGNLEYLMMFEPVQMEIAGKNVYMRILVSANYEMNANNAMGRDSGVYYFIGAYTDAMKDGSVMVCMTTKDFPSVEELPAKEDIMDALEEIFAGITIM